MVRIKEADAWWALPTGPKNSIADVQGVRVGHATLIEGSARTGVTAILPHSGNLFTDKVPAGSAVINGFGKTVGLMQQVELGQIETPILLTNTFGVPACATALIRAAIKANPTIGRDAATVNPLVFECNDGTVNDIQTLSVTEETAAQAIAAASEEFAQGTVGAGTGMRTFEMAGGVGTASRMVTLPSGTPYTVGVFVLSNFGQAGEMRIFGQRLDPVPRQSAPPADPERGSIIIIIATDAPFETRQLARLARRGAPALGRLGSFVGHGSGDVALAFTTAYTVAAAGEEQSMVPRLSETVINPFFHAVVEATEEAILNAMLHAKSHTGYDGARLPTLRERADAAGMNLAFEGIED